MLSIKQRRCAEDIKVGWMDWMVTTDGEINNGLTLNTCIGRGGSWAALLLGFCCSVGSSSQLLLTHASLVHSPVKLALGAEASTTPPLFFPYICNEKCSWAPFLLMALSCLWFAHVFQKQVVVPRKRQKGTNSSCNEWLRQGNTLKLKNNPVLKCEGRQWSAFDYQVTLTNF